jgi:hypothetical protein
MTDIPNLTDAELNKLKACKNETDWNATCDAVKGARGGIYPIDWFRRVQMSGLMNDLFSTFEAA